jgi:hypothetical protein
MKEGDIVSIYTQYKVFEGYQGDAVLIQRVKVGDTFYRDNEKLFTDNRNFDALDSQEDSKLPSKVLDFSRRKDKLSRAESDKALTKIQKENNRKYIRLRYLLNDGSKELRSFNSALKKLVKPTIESIHNMNNFILEQRVRYKKSARKIKAMLSEFTNDEIIRFMQQEHIKDWTPTIYQWESWTVEFPGPQYCTKTGRLLVHTNHRTVRKIAKIVCVAPNESAQTSDLVKHTTYNGISNYSKEQDRLDRRIEDVLSDIPEDVDFDAEPDLDDIMKIEEGLDL